MMDSVTAGNAAVAASLRAASVPAAKCNRCGCTSVVWVKSKRTNKNYLAEGHSSGTAGRLIPEPHHPHFKICGTDQGHCGFWCGCRAGGIETS